MKKLHGTKITNESLIHRSLIALAIELVVCIMYTYLHESNGGVVKTYDNDAQKIQVACNDSEALAFLVNANYIVAACVLLIYTYFAAKSRKSSKVFKESICAFFGTFFTIFVFLIVVAFNILIDDLEIITTVQSTILVVLLLVIWALFYGMFLIPNTCNFCIKDRPLPVRTDHSVPPKPQPDQRNYSIVFVYFYDVL